MYVFLDFELEIFSYGDFLLLEIRNLFFEGTDGKFVVLDFDAIVFDAHDEFFVGNSEFVLFLILFLQFVFVGILQVFDLLL